MFAGPVPAYLFWMEDGTVSRISNSYSLRQGRRQPPTSEVKELQFIHNCNCNVKKEIKPPTGVEKL
jgi:hypothetical protein